MVVFMFSSSSRRLAVLCALLSIIACAQAVPIGMSLDEAEQKVHDMFVAWKAKFNRAYEGAEHSLRFEVFKQNIKYIEEHNALFRKGEETFEMAVNKFADMSREDYKKMLGYKPDLRKQGLGAKAPGLACTHKGKTPADTMDWVSGGAVTPVKDQGQCGSCWSFSTTGAVEGAWAVSGNGLVSLSEEELVQCDNTSDEGCNGGLMDNAFEFIIEMGGITSEELYPYISGNGTTGTCRARLMKKKIATISDFCDVTPNNETDLMLAVTQQPVAVAIEADQTAFQFYMGGIIPARKCGVNLDHGVLATGYGFDAKHKMHYWTVKNSWGPNWGESGYVRIQKDPKKVKHSACGIASDASYPVV